MLLKNKLNAVPTILKLLKHLNSIFGHFVAWLILVYQLLFSPDHSPLWRARHPYGYCQFYPTCSEYSRKAFSKYGFIKGLIISTWRILRCRPGKFPIVEAI